MNHCPSHSIGKMIHKPRRKIRCLQGKFVYVGRCLRKQPFLLPPRRWERIARRRRSSSRNVPRGEERGRSLRT